MIRIKKRRVVRPLSVAVAAFALGTGAIGAVQAAPGSPSSAADLAPNSVASTAPVALSDPGVPEVVRSGAARKVGALAGTQMLRLSIGLHPTNQAAMTAFLAAVQDKKSPQFHKFLTAQQWNARFAPSAADEATIVSWAGAHGLTVTQRFANRLLVDLAGDATTVQNAFGVHLSTYSGPGRTFYSNEAAPVLPSAVSAAVASIGGLSNYGELKPASPTMKEPAFPSFVAGPARATGAGAHGDAVPSAVARMRRTVAAKQAAAKQAAAGKAKAAAAGGVAPRITGGAYDPTDIYSSQAYDTAALNAQGHCCNPTHLADAPAQNDIAIATVGTQAVSDMAGFQAQYPYLAYSFQEFNIDGTGPAGDGEGTMDLEWSTAIANSFGSFHDTSKVYMYDGVNAQISTFNDIWNHMLSDNLARTMSTSWGCAEVSCWTTSLIGTTHGIFDAMIGQGWTLTAASGDHGAYQDLNPSAKSVNYPASDPDVIAAGGTTLHLNSGPSYVSESAWAGGPAGAASNDGGGGGGCSVVFARPSYQSSVSLCGTTGRALPDISLNADWYNTPQNMYMGGLFGNGGTSIVAPELAGFFAQSNAYLLFDGHGPQGNPLPQLYSIAGGASPHNPYYDITSGCTSNDIGSGFCGIVGYDRATGLGSNNMLQLAWALNWQDLPDAGRPTVSFSGPATGSWYRTDQTVSWTVADTGSPASGVAGYSRGWDSVPVDPTTEPTPGSGAAFYGPQVPNGTSGSLFLSSAGQGCHTAEVEAWDNMGYQSGVATYGSLCYDSVAPTISKAPATALISGAARTTAGVPIKISWAGTDATSGIASYTLSQSTDGGAYAPVFSGNVTSSTRTLAAKHSYRFQVTATDVAGNVSAAKLGKQFNLDVIDDVNASSIAFSSGWTRVNQTGALGGQVMRATATGKTATLTFTGKQFAWLTTEGSTHGSATIAVDGGSSTTIDTNAATTQPGIVLGVKSVTSGSHTYQVKTLGTAGHPQVDVDGFVIIS